MVRSLTEFTPTHVTTLHTYCRNIVVWIRVLPTLPMKLAHNVAGRPRNQRQLVSLWIQSVLARLWPRQGQVYDQGFSSLPVFVI